MMEDNPGLDTKISSGDKKFVLDGDIH